MLNKIKEKLNKHLLLKSILKGFGLVLILFIVCTIIVLIQWVLECIWLPLGTIFILIILGIIFSSTYYNSENNKRK